MNEIGRIIAWFFQMSKAIRNLFYESLVTGIAHVLPLLATVIILVTIIDFIIQLLQPVGILVRTFWLGTVSHITIEATLLALFLIATLFLGLLIEIATLERSTNKLHSLIGAIPGVGSVYLIFRRMSESLFQSDTKSFREVKLVEYPNEGTYSFGFVTDYSPNKVRAAVEYEDMQTLFMPLAPNPVLGGRVIYVPTDYIYDIDMTVEEAIRTLVTSGVVTQTQKELTDQSSTDEKTRNGPSHSK